MQEHELIQKLCERDETAFRFLIDQYKQPLFRVCIGFVHDKDDAEDLTQEVFIEVFHSIHKFKGQARLSTWLYRIAVNKSLNHLEKKKGGFLVSLKIALGLEKESPSNPQKDLLIKERNSVLANAIENLPENQRIAFTLAKYEELSYKEIADVMQTSVPAVESLLHRARLNLQKMLKTYIQEKK